MNELEQLKQRVKELEKDATHPTTGVSYRSMFAAEHDCLAILEIERDQLRERIKELEMRAEAEYCEDCGTPLSQCGPLGPDGIPTMDCQVCQLREQLAAMTKERDDALEHQEVPFHTCAGKDCKNKTCQLRQQLAAIQHALLATEYVIQGEVHEPNLVERAKYFINERARLRHELAAAQAVIEKMRQELNSHRSCIGLEMIPKQPSLALEEVLRPWRDSVTNLTEALIKSVATPHSEQIRISALDQARELLNAGERKKT